jgi:hypothetical protein
VRPYLIGTPPYDPTSGGRMVLHRLVHELNTHGAEAYTLTKSVNTDWNTPYYGNLSSYGPFEDWQNDKNPIAIYAESTHVNIFNTKTIIAYILSNQVPSEFIKQSKITFIFSELFNNNNLSKNHILFLPVIDTNFYTEGEENREFTSYYIGKGTQTFKINQSLEIPKTLSPFERRDILRKSKIFYSYDNITGMTEISRLCGCPTVIVPNGEFTKEQYAKHEMGWNGLGWGEPPKYFNISQFRETYLSVKEDFNQKLDYFIEVTQNG